MQICKQNRHRTFNPIYNSTPVVCAGNWHSITAIAQTKTSNSFVVLRNLQNTPDEKKHLTLYHVKRIRQLQGALTRWEPKMELVVLCAICTISSTFKPQPSLNPEVQHSTQPSNFISTLKCSTTYMKLPNAGCSFRFETTFCCLTGTIHRFHLDS